MLEVQKQAAIKAIRVLEALKEHVQFAVEFDEQTYGNRELKPTKKERKRNGDWPTYKRGTTRKHYLPYFNNAKVGDVIEVPFGEFDGRVLSANISAACVHTFGKGNATVHRNNTNQTVEVLITGMDPTVNPARQMEMFDADGTDLL